MHSSYSHQKKNDKYINCFRQNLERKYNNVTKFLFIYLFFFFEELVTSNEGYKENNGIPQPQQLDEDDDTRRFKHDAIPGIFPKIKPTKGSPWDTVVRSQLGHIEEKPFVYPIMNNNVQTYVKPVTSNNIAELKNYMEYQKLAPEASKQKISEMVKKSQDTKTDKDSKWS